MNIQQSLHLGLFLLTLYLLAEFLVRFALDISITFEIAMKVFGVTFN